MKGKTLEHKNLATIIREFLDKRPPRLLEVRSFERHSAVLIPLFGVEEEYKVLFTKRTSMVETHKGQISFPGGAVDKNDGSFVETALREAYEETGYINVYDRKIKCWYYPNHHGRETFVEAMENSCNPVFVQVGQNIGRDNFHDGLVKFGLNDELAIQLPGVVEYKVREKIRGDKCEEEI